MKARRLAFLVAASFAVLGAFFIGTVLVLRATGVVEVFKVPTGAMEPFINPGDHVVAESFTLRRRQPTRGEVVTLSTTAVPIQWRGSSEPTIWIKRVVGLPGDNLAFKDGVLQINDRPVSEFFDASAVHCTEAKLLTATTPVIVPPDHVFVIGDNGKNSLDSRYFGPLPVAGLRHLYWFHLYHAPAPATKR